jgi:hypothetical protein
MGGGRRSGHGREEARKLRSRNPPPPAGSGGAQETHLHLHLPQRAREAPPPPAPASSRSSTSTRAGELEKLAPTAACSPPPLCSRSSPRPSRAREARPGSRARTRWGWTRWGEGDQERWERNERQ